MTKWNMMLIQLVLLPQKKKKIEQEFHSNWIHIHTNSSTSFLKLLLWYSTHFKNNNCTSNRHGNQFNNLATHPQFSCRILLLNSASLNLRSLIANLKFYLQWFSRRRPCDYQRWACRPLVSMKFVEFLNHLPIPK